MTFVRVAFPVPVRQTFLYSVPPGLEERARPGAEVRCPFGRGERRGFIVEPAREADRPGVKAIAGYLLDQGGRRWIVVCIVNHPRAAAAQATQDALLQWVYAR